MMSLPEGIQSQGRTSAAGRVPGQDPVSDLAASSLCFGAGSRSLPRGSRELQQPLRGKDQRTALCQALPPHPCGCLQIRDVINYKLLFP